MRGSGSSGAIYGKIEESIKKSGPLVNIRTSELAGTTFAQRQVLLGRLNDVGWIRDLNSAASQRKFLLSCLAALIDGVSLVPPHETNFRSSVHNTSEDVRVAKEFWEQAQQCENFASLLELILSDDKAALRFAVLSTLQEFSTDFQRKALFAALEKVRAKRPGGKTPHFALETRSQERRRLLFSQFEAESDFSALRLKSALVVYFQDVLREERAQVYRGFSRRTAQLVPLEASLSVLEQHVEYERKFFEYRWIKARLRDQAFWAEWENRVPIPCEPTFQHIRNQGGVVLDEDAIQRVVDTIKANPKQRLQYFQYKDLLDSVMQASDLNDCTVDRIITLARWLYQLPNKKPLLQAIEALGRTIAVFSSNPPAPLMGEFYEYRGSTSAKLSRLYHTKTTISDVNSRGTAESAFRDLLFAAENFPPSSVADDNYIRSMVQCIRAEEISDKSLSAAERALVRDSDIGQAHYLRFIVTHGLDRLAIPLLNTQFLSMQDASESDALQRLYDIWRVFALRKGWKRQRQRQRRKERRRQALGEDARQREAPNGEENRIEFFKAVTRNPSGPDEVIYLSITPNGIATSQPDPTWLTQFLARGVHLSSVRKADVPPAGLSRSISPDHFFGSFLKPLAEYLPRLRDNLEPMMRWWKDIVTAMLYKATMKQTESFTLETLLLERRADLETIIGMHDVTARAYLRIKSIPPTQPGSRPEKRRDVSYEGLLARAESQCDDIGTLFLEDESNFFPVREADGEVTDRLERMRHLSSSLVHINRCLRLVEWQLQNPENDKLLQNPLRRKHMSLLMLRSSIYHRLGLFFSELTDLEAMVKISRRYWPSYAQSSLHYRMGVCYILAGNLEAAAAELHKLNGLSVTVEVELPGEDVNAALPEAPKTRSKRIKGSQAALSLKIRLRDLLAQARASASAAVPKAPGELSPWHNIALKGLEKFLDAGLEMEAFTLLRREKRINFSPMRTSRVVLWRAAVDEMLKENSVKGFVEGLLSVAYEHCDLASIGVPAVLERSDVAPLQSDAKQEDRVRWEASRKKLLEVPSLRSLLLSTIANGACLMDNEGAQLLRDFQNALGTCENEFIRAEKVLEVEAQVALTLQAQSNAALFKFNELVKDLRDRLRVNPKLRPGSELHKCIDKWISLLDQEQRPLGIDMSAADDPRGRLVAKAKEMLVELTAGTATIQDLDGKLAYLGCCQRPPCTAAQRCILGDDCHAHEGCKMLLEMLEAALPEAAPKFEIEVRERPATETEESVTSRVLVVRGENLYLSQVYDEVVRRIQADTKGIHEVDLLGVNTYWDNSIQVFEVNFTFTGEYVIIYRNLDNTPLELNLAGPEVASKSFASPAPPGANGSPGTADDRCGKNALTPGLDGEDGHHSGAVAFRFVKDLIGYTKFDEASAQNGNIRFINLSGSDGANGQDGGRGGDAWKHVQPGEAGEKIYKDKHNGDDPTPGWSVFSTIGAEDGTPGVPGVNGGNGSMAGLKGYAGKNGRVMFFKGEADQEFDIKAKFGDDCPSITTAEVKDGDDGKEGAAGIGVIGGDYGLQVLYMRKCFEKGQKDHFLFSERKPGHEERDIGSYKNGRTPLELRVDGTEGKRGLDGNQRRNQFGDRDKRKHHQIDQNALKANLFSWLHEHSEENRQDASNVLSGVMARMQDEEEMLAQQLEAQQESVRYFTEMHEETMRAIAEAQQRQQQQQQNEFQTQMLDQPSAGEGIRPRIVRLDEDEEEEVDEEGKAKVAPQETTAVVDHLSRPVKQALLRYARFARITKSLLRFCQNDRVLAISLQAGDERWNKRFQSRLQVRVAQRVDFEFNSAETRQFRRVMEEDDSPGLNRLARPRQGRKSTRSSRAFGPVNRGMAEEMYEWVLKEILGQIKALHAKWQATDPALRGFSVKFVRAFIKSTREAMDKQQVSLNHHMDWLTSGIVANSNKVAEDLNALLREHPAAFVEFLSTTFRTIAAPPLAADSPAVADESEDGEGPTAALTVESAARLWLQDDLFTQLRVEVARLIARLRTAPDPARTIRRIHVQSERWRKAYSISPVRDGSSLPESISQREMDMFAKVIETLIQREAQDFLFPAHLDEAFAVRVRLRELLEEVRQRELLEEEGEGGDGARRKWLEVCIEIAAFNHQALCLEAMRRVDHPKCNVLGNVLDLLGFIDSAEHALKARNLIRLGGEDVVKRLFVEYRTMRTSMGQAG